MYFFREKIAKILIYYVYFFVPLQQIYANWGFGTDFCPASRGRCIGKRIK
jgi:hypothetical protein